MEVHNTNFIWPFIWNPYYYPLWIIWPLAEFLAFSSSDGIDNGLNMFKLAQFLLLISY